MYIHIFNTYVLCMYILHVYIKLPSFIQWLLHSSVSLVVIRCGECFPRLVCETQTLKKREKKNHLATLCRLNVKNIDVVEFEVTGRSWTVTNSDCDSEMNPEFLLKSQMFQIVASLHRCPPLYTFVRRILLFSWKKTCFFSPVVSWWKEPEDKRRRSSASAFVIHINMFLCL